MATDFELQVLQSLGEIKAQCATAVTKVEGLDTRLFNHGSGVIPNMQKDIDELKKAADNETWWDRKKDFIIIALFPITAILHATARKFGLDV